MNDLKTARILVTSTSFGMNDPSLRARLESAVGEVIYNDAGHPLTPEELIPLIQDIDGMIAGLDFITRAVFENANRLRVVARYGVGVDRVDLQAAQEKGVVVTNTPGANAVSVAELAVGLILALIRHIPAANSQTKQGNWPRLKGTTLQGKVVGLLGLGAIGQSVARMLAGFGCGLIGYDPMIDVAAARAFGVEWMPGEQVIRTADILSLHLPATPATENMFNSDLFATMKDGAYLINTARSEIVDEMALVAALQSGKLAGAAMDTFRQEPPPADHPLLQLEQVIVTPHTGSHTDNATITMGRMALEDCLAVLRGEAPQHPV